jgi:lysyl-tRNA synthetase class 2
LSARKKIFRGGVATLVGGFAQFVSMENHVCGYQDKPVIPAFLVEDVGADQFDFLKKLIDIGDIIQVEGLFQDEKTRKHSTPNHSSYYQSRLPAARKMARIKNVDTRYRRRYVDLIMNPEVKKIFETRSLVVKNRNYLEDNGFIEVETPVLQQIPGGTNAKPFITHINAFDMDFYLRIAPELYLKRLIVGGFERVFERHIFRNEVGCSFNPDFTMCEFYWAYQDCKAGAFTEQMLSTLCRMC